MPAKWNTILHAVQSTGIVVGVVILALKGRMSWDVAASVIASLGGVWAGVGGALAASTRNAAATVSKVDTVPPVASPTPADAQPAGYPPGRVPSDASPPAAS